MALPMAAGAIVLIVASLAGPRDAWLPYAIGPATPDAWMQVPSWPLDRLPSFPLHLAGLAGGTPVIPAAITLASGMAALSSALLVVSLRSTGLSPMAAAALALIAAVGPLGAWQAMSPLGTAPIALLSSAALVLAMRGTSRAPARTWAWRDAALRASGPVGLIVLAEGMARVVGWGGPWAAARADLGGLGVVLAGVGSAGLAGPPVTRALVGLALVHVITTAMAPELRAAALLPWLWWLVGAGASDLQSLRERRSANWLLVGLAAWLAIGTATIPWLHQRQQATLVRSWADGLAAGTTSTHPWLVDASATGRLLAVRTPHTIPWPAREAEAAVVQALRPSTSAIAARLRWQGFGLARVTLVATESLITLLDVLPPHTIVVAAISEAGASTLTPADWQALGRVGLRAVDAGIARAHVLVGATAARAQGLEDAHPGHATVQIQPGTPLGRLPLRSPVDAEVTAAPATVDIRLHSHPLVAQARGLALAFFTVRGDLLAWRAGASAAALTGPSLGAGAASDVAVLARLACRVIEPGRAYRLADLGPSGAIGLTATRQTLVELPEPAERLTLSAGTPLGLEVRGPRRLATVRADAAITACDAWPVEAAVDLAAAPFEQPVSPDVDASYGEGWHATEGTPGTYFRWSAGARADWHLALTSAQALSVTVDVQGPDSADAGDTLGLVANGQPVGLLTLPAGRALRTWHVPADRVRRGLNTFTLATTRTVRPADRHAGTDGRVLGVAVRHWRVARATDR